MTKKRNGFDELFAAMAAGRKRCPWAKEMTLKESAEFILAEAKELMAEVEKNSVEEMKEELGDILAVSFFFAVLAREKGYFSINDALKNAVEKFKRRKPWIFDEKIKIENSEEAKRFYLQAKQKEKSEKAAKKDRP